MNVYICFHTLLHTGLSWKMIYLAELHLSLEQLFNLTISWSVLLVKVDVMFHKKKICMKMHKLNCEFLYLKTSHEYVY